jgi:hypothetical protein
MSSVPAEADPLPAAAGCGAGACAPPVLSVAPWDVAEATRIKKIPSATAQAATRSGRGLEKLLSLLLRGRLTAGRG